MEMNGSQGLTLRPFPFVSRPTAAFVTYLQAESDQDGDESNGPDED